MKIQRFRSSLSIALLTLALSACGGGGGGNANSSANSSISSSVISSTESSASSIAVSSANSSEESSASSSVIIITSSSSSSNSSSSVISSSSSSEDSQPILTVPDLVDVTSLNLIQDQLVNISLDNIGGKNLTDCSSDLPEIFTVTISDDATTCVISGEASELIDLTTFTVTATNIVGSDTAQISLQVQAATPFITTWKTDNEGVSDDNQITITTSPNFSYDYTIDWGDGSTDEHVAGDITHTYAVPGEYQLAIVGRFPQTYFNSFNEITDANKLVSVDAWGNRIWLSMEYSFAGASDLVINDTQAPNLSRVTSMFGTFGAAINFNSDISHWDVSNVTDMTGTFYQAENFNGDLSLWDVSNVSSMSYMFNGAFKFNRDINNWNVTHVNDMSYMFNDASSFNQNISSWDVANVTNFESIFEDASAFNQNLGSWNISSATFVDYFAVDSGLSVGNYDALLLGWSLLPLQHDLTLDIGSIQYSPAAEAAHFILTDTFGWTIFDGGLLTLPDLHDQTAKGQTNDQLTISLNNTGGKPDSCVADTLPDGLSVQITNNTCEIVGAVATPQTSSFTITATNMLGSNSALVELTVEEQTPFITHWKTDNPGMSDDNQITIDTSPNVSYDYRIEWGDGSVDEHVTGDITHTYAAPGEYDVSITGTYPQPYFNSTTDPTKTDSQKLLSVEQWGNRTWRSMNQAFFDCRNLAINDTNAPDLSQVTSMTSMFTNADNLSGNINNWDVSNVLFMSNMFNGADNFNLDIGSWNVANVISMNSMFTNTKFNQDISGWNVSNVTDMSAMFKGVTEFNQPIGNWDVAKVMTMSDMFNGATTFNQPIGNWNVAKVTSMTNMFRIAKQFNQDISQWNTAKVFSMSGMFREARAFNQDIGNWDVSNVSNMGDMFFATDVFNADISNWDVSKLTNMSRMFRGSKVFNQNLGSWNVSNVTTMSDLFVAGVLTTENYDAMLTGWSQLPSLKTGVVLNVGTTTFSAAAQTARDTLVNNFGWVITDGGLQP